MIPTSSFFDLVQQGGIATWVLLLLSVASLALALSKLYELRGVGGRASERLADQVQAAAARGDFRAALDACQSAGANGAPLPLATVFRSVLEWRGAAGAGLREASLARLDRETMRQERGLGWFATLASVAPFIGLFGTVVGIIRAFDALGADGSIGAGGLAPVMSGIAESLVATAAGLIVAVPAVVFYNLLSRRLRRERMIGEQGIAVLCAELDARMPSARPSAASSSSSPTAAPAPAAHAPLIV